MFHFDEVKLNRPIGQSFPLSTSVGVVEYVSKQISKTCYMICDFHFLVN